MQGLGRASTSQGLVLVHVHYKLAFQDQDKLIMHCSFLLVSTAFIRPVCIVNYIMPFLCVYIVSTAFITLGCE